MPVFWSRSAGARTSGRGRGKAVRYGFVFRAVVMDSSALGGQIRVISWRRLVWVVLSGMNVRAKPAGTEGHAPEMPMR